ncbi:MAG: methyl-accepting chemotaxis protein [Treponema sp.]|nr:methyl-accepting chemotaxis protein [Treponema sp.]
MKLNHKFSLIVILTVLLISILTYTTLATSRKMQSLKQYQYTQSETKAELGALTNYLMNMDFRGFHVNVCYNEWQEKVKKLDDKFEYLLNDPITKDYQEEMSENLEQIQTIWELLKNRFEPIEGVLQQIQDTKLTNAIKSDIEKYGIREFVTTHPEDQTGLELLGLLELAHAETEGVYRLHDSIAKLNLQSAYTISEIITKYEKSYTIIAIIMTIITGAILSILIYTVTTKIAKRITSIQKVTSVLAEKDFTASIKPNGSTEMQALMKNLNIMVDQINDFFIVVKTTASKAISSGYSINDSANSTAAATLQIDSNLENLNNEFENITRTTQQAIDAIAEMNNHIQTLVSNNSLQTNAIENSNNAVNKVVTTLEYMNIMARKRTQSASDMQILVDDGDDKISKTNEMLDKITNQLDEVKGIVNIINSVAKKTNLLSMNAAIESAHAGESGKGFAVVAGEIRTLADETQKNAERIQSVVQNIVTSVSEANRTSSSASTAFSRVKEQAEEIVSSLQEITNGIGKIDGEMHNIQTQADETARLSEGMNQFCENLTDKQNLVAHHVEGMADLIVHTLEAIRQIKKGTKDIVNRMRDVSESSKESYKNMTDLENVLEEFKTKSEVEDAVAKADSENAIENAVSAELAAEFAEENPIIKPEDAEEIEFDLDSVEEY